MLACKAGFVTPTKVISLLNVTILYPALTAEIDNFKNLAAAFSRRNVTEPHVELLGRITPRRPVTSPHATSESITHCGSTEF
jgi:hypothetical protein